jgi:hypothetical protein
MRALSISRLFVIGPLVVGLSVAWTIVAPRSITGQRVAGGWERCDGTKTANCNYQPGCTGKIVACSKTWGAPRDCSWVSGQTCDGASGCEDKRDSSCP